MARNYTSGVEEMQVLYAGIKKIEVDFYKSVEFDASKCDSRCKCIDCKLHVVGKGLTTSCKWLEKILSSWPYMSLYENKYMNVIDELTFFVSSWETLIVNTLKTLNLPTCFCMKCLNCGLQSITVCVKTYLQWMTDIIHTWYKPQLLILNQRVRKEVEEKEKE